MSSNPGHPWNPDRALDLDLVRQLVASVAPELRDEPVYWVGEGWDNEVYAAGDEWLFRFPKRADVGQVIGAEGRTGERLADAPFEVPRWEYVADSTALFPHPFVGYRRVPGVSLAEEMPPRAAWHVLATDLADCLDSFARLTAESQELKTNVVSPERLREEADDAIIRLENTEPPDLTDRWRSFLATTPTPARFQHEPVFLHNDLSRDHLFVDPSSWRLTGVIDFADQELGDPIVELVGLAAAFDVEFAIEVGERQQSWPFEEEARRRLAYFSAIMPVRWAANAADRGEDITDLINIIDRSIASYHDVF